MSTDDSMDSTGCCGEADEMENVTDEVASVVDGTAAETDESGIEVDGMVTETDESMIEKTISSDEEGEHTVENVMLCSFAHRACSPLLQGFLHQ